jgi:hypothetical protein
VEAGRRATEVYTSVPVLCRCIEGNTRPSTREGREGLGVSWGCPLLHCPDGGGWEWPGGHVVGMWLAWVATPSQVIRDKMHAAS